MTTVHAYTSDQKPLDSNHTDPRRARACNMSLIPTSTGATESLGLVIPALSGKIGGTSVRVPTPNVSMIDLTFVSSKKTDIAEINTAMELASRNELSGVLGYNELPLVSIDFNHNPNSSILMPRRPK